MAQFYQVVNGNTFTIEELRAMYPNIQNLQCIDGSNASIQYIINQDDSAVQYHNQVIGIDQTGATVQFETYQHQPVVLDSSLTQQGVYVIEAVEPSAQVAVDLHDHQVIAPHHATPQFVVQQLQAQLSSQNHTSQTHLPSQQPHAQIQPTVEGQQQTIVYGTSQGDNGIALLDASLQLSGATRLVADPENNVQKTQVSDLAHSSPNLTSVAKLQAGAIEGKSPTQLVAHVSQLQGSVIQLSNGQKITLTDWQQLQQQQLHIEHDKVQSQAHSVKHVLTQQTQIHHQVQQERHQHQIQLQTQVEQPSEQNNIQLPTESAHLQQQPVSTQPLQPRQIQQIQHHLHPQQVIASPQQPSQALQQQHIAQPQLQQQIEQQQQIQIHQHQHLQLTQMHQHLQQQQLDQHHHQIQQQITPKSNTGSHKLFLEMANSQPNNGSPQNVNLVSTKPNERSGVITCQSEQTKSAVNTPIVRTQNLPQQRKPRVQQQRKQQPRINQPAIICQPAIRHQHPSQRLFSHNTGNCEQSIIQSSPRVPGQVPSSRRTYANKRGRSHNLIANNTLQAIASPTGEQQNLLQKHDNVISVGGQNNQIHQTSPAKDMPQQSKNNQVLLVFQNGDQQILNVEGDGVRSIKDILEQIGIHVDSNATITSDPSVPCDTPCTPSSTETIKNEPVLDVPNQEHIDNPGKELQTSLSEKTETSSEIASMQDIKSEPGDTTEQKSISPELPKYVDGMLAICRNCGYTSLDFNRCQRCRKRIPESAKSIPAPDTPKKTVSPHSKEKCSKLMLKVEPEGGKSIRRNRTVKRTRKLVEEPVILTLSSDDEDQRQQEKENSLDRSYSNHHNLPIENTHFGSLDNSMTSSVMDKEPIISSQEDNDSVTSDAQDVQKGSGIKLNLGAIIDGSVPGQFTTLQCRTVRIGSYKVIPTERVILSSAGVQISVPTIEDESKSVTLLLDIREVVKVLIHFGRGMPVLFFYAQPAAAARIRNILQMESRNGPYYDPVSQDDTQKRITLLPERLNEDSKTILKDIFGSINVLEELNNKEANDILVRASPKEVHNMMKKAAGLSPQKSTTEIHTILVYPPHPGKGGIPINTEDYACLGEDQFLNDVIIDFYLRYLTLSVLSEYDQQRTHVFSSFFYKRLTTRPPRSARRSHPVEDDPKLTAAEKRHSRVKSWTKNVNLFEKDFVVIPINEHCHWFLAIICFPGLTCPVRMSDNTPVNEPVNQNRAKSKKKLPETSPPKSVQIGCTTITPVKCTDTITLEIGEEGSDRDEAEGEDEDMDHSSTDEEDGVSPSEEGNSSKTIAASQPPKETPKAKSRKINEPIKQPCILIFDSLAGASRTRVVATLRDYLRIESKVKGGKDRDFSKDTIRGASPKVPQQTNFTDCGLYLLQYVESFFQDPIKDYRLPMRALVNWFPEEVVNRKREDLQKLLISLMEESGVDIASINLPKLTFASRNQEGKEKMNTSDESENPPQEGNSGPADAVAEEDSLSKCSSAVDPQINSSGNSTPSTASGFINSLQETESVKSERISLVNYSDDSDEKNSDDKNSTSVDSDTYNPVQNRKSNTLTYLKTKRIERHMNKEIDRTPPKRIRTDVNNQDNR